ncbi:MAG: helix-turn-helix domain-containing protein [Oscillospiraceae bacterium]|nr:helix-turn-helix domain-containing protein [Oscillospiraceae bacterium]
MSYINGGVIKSLREKKNLTQKQLGALISVSDKTISKWETEKGLPDITLLGPLASALGISVAELLSGESIINKNRAGNVAKIKFHVCPICGNIIFSLGEGAFSCCGVSLPALLPEKHEGALSFSAENDDGELYIRFSHPMTKEHYISFIAFASFDSVTVKKLYPEQEAAARFPLCKRGKIFVFCNKDGLFEFDIASFR